MPTLPPHFLTIGNSFWGKRSGEGIVLLTANYQCDSEMICLLYLMEMYLTLSLPIQTQTEAPRRSIKLTAVDSHQKVQEKRLGGPVAVQYVEGS